MGKLRASLRRFISLIHTTWCNDIRYEILFPRQLYFAYIFGCIFHLMGVVLDTEI